MDHRSQPTPSTIAGVIVLGVMLVALAVALLLGALWAPPRDDGRLLTPADTGPMRAVAERHCGLPAGSLYGVRIYEDSVSWLYAGGTVTYYLNGNGIVCG